MAADETKQQYGTPRDQLRALKTAKPSGPSVPSTSHRVTARTTSPRLRSRRWCASFSFVSGAGSAARRRGHRDRRRRGARRATGTTPHARHPGSAAERGQNLLAAPAVRGAHEFDSYLRANAERIPNYGERRRAGEAISTAFVESTVNQVISKRMVKKTADALDTPWRPPATSGPYPSPQQPTRRRLPPRVPQLQPHLDSGHTR
jgi:hypothetical protein